MRYRQIFEKDFPNNRKLILEYTSNYYYKLDSKQTKKAEGWIFEWKKTPFKQVFRKKWKGNLFEIYKKAAEYYVLENNQGNWNCSI